MFEEAEDLDHPYFKTKHDSEALVRNECKRPFRIYRPGFVVGDSKTGYIDKIDGPYYFFKTIQKFRELVPQWVPAIGIEGGRINIVPVDFVANALDYLAHKKGLDGKCFHLTDPHPYRIGEVLNIFAKAAHAPQMTMRINAKMFGFIPAPILYGIGSLAPVKRAIRVVLNDLGIPRDVFQFVNWPTRYDNREAAKALKGSGIEVPKLDTYAWRLWDYWERHLDPDLFIDRTLAGRVRDKVIVVTGGSSGIGQATAMKLAEAGAKVIIVARDPEKLRATARTSLRRREMLHVLVRPRRHERDRRAGEEDSRRAQGRRLPRQQRGRSIRRAVLNSLDRFHDFERTMQLNYFGPVRLISRSAEDGRAEARAHHQHQLDRRAVARAALLGLRRVEVGARRVLGMRGSEVVDKGIHFTNINMPLVRTPMIAPTKIYENVPTLSPEEAAGLVVEAIVHRPVRIATRLGIFGAVCHAIAPKVTQVLLNTAFNMFPDSTAAQGKKDGEAQPLSAEQMAFAQLTQGIHW
jgi:NAD(P)-dependent dehydrogenase (short-subunit alcohol dehydrogenase family)